MRNCAQKRTRNHARNRVRIHARLRCLSSGSAHGFVCRSVRGLGSIARFRSRFLATNAIPRVLAFSQSFARAARVDCARSPPYITEGPHHRYLHHTLYGRKKNISFRLCFPKIKPPKILSKMQSFWRSWCCW